MLQNKMSNIYSISRSPKTHWPVLSLHTTIIKIDLKITSTWLTEIYIWFLWDSNHSQ